MKKVSIFVLTIISTCTISCSSGLSGIYKPSSNSGLGEVIDQIEFVSSSKAKITSMGMSTEVTYELNGKELKFTTDQGNQILTIDANGCIDGGKMLGKFCK
ncbi:hypothetical protein [Sediminibacterium sp. C3]|jgi:hypothetical protein|uniref:hypothetical protein n=1 Tax=Sediminibacterium sp. C3 TaxID=1267211 RepID=UPI0012686E5A|nr:hypothetical protein [Sediminibacterium sp. C3]